MSNLEILIAVIALAEVACVFINSKHLKHSENVLDWHKLESMKRREQNKDHWESTERMIEDRIDSKFSQWTPVEMAEIKKIDRDNLELQVEQAKSAVLAYEASVKEKEAECKLLDIKLKLKERELEKVKALTKLQEPKNESES